MRNEAGFAGQMLSIREQFEAMCATLVPNGYTRAEWDEHLRLNDEARLSGSEPPPVRIHLPDGRLHYTLKVIDGEWQRVDPPEPVRPPKRQQPAPAEFVYFIGTKGGPVKIGMAADPASRLVTLQCASPFPLTILATRKGGRPQEREYHKRFAEHRLQGEWFDRHPDILAEIERLSA